MGCLIYYVVTKGRHPFNKGHDNDYTVHQNVKNYVICDFQLLNDKPVARALIKNMIKRNKDSRYTHDYFTFLLILSIIIDQVLVKY